MKTQNEKSAAFRALHERLGAFVIPNPWDVGSAKLLEREGFEALATSSAGCAFALGRRDNNIGVGNIAVRDRRIRDEMSHVQIVKV